MKNTTAIIGAIVLLLAGAGGYFLVSSQLDQNEALATGPEPVPEPETRDIGEVAEMPADPVVDETVIPSEQTESEAEVVEAEVPAPEFDIVRVEPDGSAVIAGRALPNSEISVLLDGLVISVISADATGGFVTLLDVGSSELPRVISLLQLGSDKVETASVQSVILAPTPKAPIPEPEVAVVSTNEEDETAEVAAQEGTVVEGELAEGPEDVAVAPEDETDVLPETDQIAALAPVEEQVVEPPTEPVTETATLETGSAQPAPDVPSTPEPDGDVVSTVRDTPGSVPAPAEEEPAEAPPLPVVTDDAPADPVEGPVLAEADAAVPEVVAEPVPETTEASPSAPTVLLADDTGIRVLQSDAPPSAQANVSIDAITYDTEGDVALSGRTSSGDSFVRVYIDNQVLLTEPVGEDGQWRAELPDVDTGVYTLRVDELNADGAVTSRTETPFKRESPETIQALDDEASATLSTVQLITVQPGNTLWGIADQKYGEGFLFVRVFEANADRIRDPDLIFPGQIFTLPEE